MDLEQPEVVPAGIWTLLAIRQSVRYWTFADTLPIRCCSRVCKALSAGAFRQLRRAARARAGHSELAELEDLDAGL